MEKSILKNRAAYPFETIGVAIAFSPRLEAILCESKRLSVSFNAKMVLIHIGNRTESQEKDLIGLLVKHNFEPHSYQIVWAEGHPADAILKTCKEHVVDLLIAGAMEKESIFRYYIGSVSREICRKAKCSVLMFTEPSIEGTSFRKIVVNGVEHTKTKHTVGASLYLARCEKSEGINVVRELHLPALAMSNASNTSDPEQMKNDLILEETEKLNELIMKMDTSGVSVKTSTVFGKTGHAISSYAKEMHADLLVINSPDHHLSILDRLFTHDIEYILADLPCNLLIVHSRVDDEMKRVSY